MKLTRLLLSAGMTVVAAVVVLAAFAQETYTGQWLIEHAGNDSVHFSIRYSSEGEHGNWFNSSMWSTDTALASLQGLNSADLNSSAGTNLHFKLVRDAGNFDCTGWGRNGDASGHWTFEPSATFAQELRKRGLPGPAPSEQFDMAMSDVTLSLIDELKNDGYHLDLSDIIRAGKHGVSVDYVRGMKAAGYKFDDIETLTKMRDHGVTPKYVQEMASFGFKNLSSDDLRRLRDHGITAQYMHDMEQAGYKGLSADEAVRMRDHGVSAEYISGMVQAGYKNLNATELARLRDHGITPEYVRDLAQAGVTNLGTTELQRLRDHGVDAGYIRDLKAAGVSSTDAYELTRMRDVGVNANFIRDAKEHGFTTTDPEELIRLRTRGFDRRASF